MTTKSQLIPITKPQKQMMNLKMNPNRKKHRKMNLKQIPNPEIQTPLVQKIRKGKKGGKEAGAIPETAEREVGETVLKIQSVIRVRVMEGVKR